VIEFLAGTRLSMPPAHKEFLETVGKQSKVKSLGRE